MTKSHNYLAITRMCLFAAGGLLRREGRREPRGDRAGEDREEEVLAA